MNRNNKTIIIIIATALIIIITSIVIIVVVNKSKPTVDNTAENSSTTHIVEETHTEQESVTQEVEPVSDIRYINIFCYQYTAPNDNSGVCNSLYYGDAVEIEDDNYNEDYVSVKYNDVPGYVKREYITTEIQPITDLYNDYKRTDLPEQKYSENYYIDNFKTILQNPVMTSGCEITSLTMVMNYYGIDVDNVTMAKYLPYGNQGDNIFNAFIGSVYDDYSFGCYANALCKCMENYGLNKNYANISGTQVDSLLGYVAAGYPVIVWATESMNASGDGSLWLYDNQPMGYLKNEHCLVIIGYDMGSDSIALADPLEGEMTYSLSTFSERYKSQFMQSVLVY